MNKERQYKAMLTFAHTYRTVGSRGTEKYFFTRDQVCGIGPFIVLVPCGKECEEQGPILEKRMFKVFLDECNPEYFLVPDDVALEGDTYIPPMKRNLKKWYQDKYWFYPVGDMRGLVMQVYGIDIYGRLEHNGEAIYEMIQAISPNKKKPKFNASCDNGFDMDMLDVPNREEEVYIINKK